MSKKIMLGEGKETEREGATFTNFFDFLVILHSEKFKLFLLDEKDQMGVCLSWWQGG